MKVCLVTSGNLASNPRLVKEALLLQDRGFSTTVVASEIIPSLSPFDTNIREKLLGGCTTVTWRAPIAVRVFRGLRKRLFAMIARVFRDVPLSVAVQALHVLTPALSKVAVKVEADLYIAHNLAALPAAAAAAKKYGAKLGFDAEDYHCGEMPHNAENALELCIRRSVESKLLRCCDLLTSASPQISAAYARDYGVTMQSILNVLPLEQAPAHQTAPHRPDGLPTLYWFSQTIGPTRGLEQIILVMASLETKVRLVLRGHPSSGYPKFLTDHARRSGGNELASRIDIVDVAPPEEMARLAAAHDLGLALEMPYTTNRDICLTNKVFTYLVAGIPTLMNKTSAQSDLAAELGSAALLVDINNIAESTEALDGYLQNRERQQCARAEAWRIGRERYNWNKEQRVFLDAVYAVLTSTT